MMRPSLLASTAIGLAIALVPSVAALPEAAAPATTTQTATSGVKQPKPYTSPNPKPYAPNHDTPVTVTVYKTVTSPPETVTKTVTTAGICSSSSLSTTQTKKYTTKSTKKSTTTTASTTISTTKTSVITTTAPACYPTSYIFQIVAGGGLEGQYLQLALDQPGGAEGLGQRVVATNNASAAEPWTIRTNEGDHVYDQSGTYGWTSKNQDFNFILPLSDQVVAGQFNGASPDYTFRYLSCSVSPSSNGLVTSVPGAVGTLGCVRSDGVVPRLVSCSGVEGLIGQQDDQPTDQDCATLTVAAIARVVTCSSSSLSQIKASTTSFSSTRQNSAIATTSTLASTSTLSTATTTSAAPPCFPSTYIFQIVSGGGLEGHYLRLDGTQADNSAGLGQRVVATTNLTSAEPWTISPLNARVYDHTGTYAWATKNQPFFFIAPITEATFASQLPLGSSRDLGVRYLPCFVGPTNDGRVNAVAGAVGALTCVRSNGVTPRLVSCPGPIRLLIGQQDDSPTDLNCATLTVAAIVKAGSC